MVSIVVGPTESKRIIGGMWVGEGWVWTELMGAIVYVGERYCSGVGSWGTCIQLDAGWIGEGQ